MKSEWPDRVRDLKQRLTYVSRGWQLEADAPPTLIRFWCLEKIFVHQNRSVRPTEPAGKKCSGKGFPLHPVFGSLSQLNSSLVCTKEEAPLALFPWRPLNCNFGSRCCACPILLQRRPMKTTLMSTSYFS